MNPTDMAFLNQFVAEHPFVFMLAVLWSLVWKGLALWRSAELRHKYWFVAILVVNTMGLLEIGYLYWTHRKYKIEVVES